MALRFARLTRTAVRSLGAGEKLTEHCITAEKMGNGDVRYSINTMVDGERIHRAVGKESEGVTREQAERTIEALRTKAREGRLDLPAGRKLHRTFVQAAEEYLERIEHHPKHGRNLGPKRRHLRQRLIPYFKAQRLGSLNDVEVSHYIKSRIHEAASTATINRELSTLSHFLNRAVDWRWISADQKPKIAKGNETAKKIVVLSTVDQKKLMDAAYGDQDPLSWLFVAIALCTGMRHSEILRITWADINFDARRIHVGKAKAGQREQPFPKSLSTALAKQHAQLGRPEGHLFPTSRTDAKYPHRQSMSEQFRRVVQRASLDPRKVTPHVLRHTAITGFVRQGVDLPTVQRISGHKTLNMVLRYTHLSDDHIDRSVAKLDSAFSDAITPKLHTSGDSGNDPAATNERKTA